MVAVALAACASPSKITSEGLWRPRPTVTSSNGVNPTTSTVLTVPTATTMAPPASGSVVATTDAPYCNITDLRVALVSSGTAAGTVEGVLGFTNTSSAPCRLSGFPSLVAFDPGGDSTAATASTNVPNGLMGQTNPVGAILLLQPAQMAAAAFTTSDTPPNGSSCPPPYQFLRVTPPGNTASVVLSGLIPWLGSDLPSCRGISISAVLPTTSFSVTHWTS